MHSEGDRPTADELRALMHRPGPGSHRTTIEIDGVGTETLADLPPTVGGLLFVGLNPSLISVQLHPAGAGKFVRDHGGLQERRGASCLRSAGT